MVTDRPGHMMPAPPRTDRMFALFAAQLSSISPIRSASWLAGVILIALMPLAGCTKNVSDKTVTRITVDDVARRVEREPDAHMIVDARPQTAYAQSRLPGARRIDFADIDTRNPDPSLRRYRSIIVYGQNPGTGSAMALTKRLMTTGYSDVRLMEEGYDRWVAKGYRVDTSSKVQVGVGGIKADDQPAPTN